MSQGLKPALWWFFYARTEAGPIAEAKANAFKIKDIQL